METIGITDDSQEMVFELLAAVQQLDNLHFATENDTCVAVGDDLANGMKLVAALLNNSEQVRRKRGALHLLDDVPVARVRVEPHHLARQENAAEGVMPQLCLVQLFESGHEIPVDREKAVQYYQLTAQSGLQEATHALHKTEKYTHKNCKTSCKCRRRLGVDEG
ncbi:hypothetical protein PF006_g11643 [Phytophthora fragariae]|uniref:Uncharacterized protein n=1 Tax=Phytophthora fragariae TaxID=53985 RepID=A0A6A3U161_9STRA|nr:hypothetical protein PF006_g11643 [Phytophthora fragariae]